jgi:hypothetical protein
MDRHPSKAPYFMRSLQELCNCRDDHDESSKVKPKAAW